MNDFNEEKSVEENNEEFVNGNVSYTDQNIQAPAQEEKKPNKFGIASLVLGITSIVLCCCGFTIILSVLGLVFAIIQMKKYNNGIAIAGLVTSIVGLVFNAYMIFDIMLSGGYGIFIDAFKEGYNQGINAASFKALIKSLF